MTIPTLKIEKYLNTVKNYEFSYDDEKQNLGTKDDEQSSKNLILCNMVVKTRGQGEWKERHSLSK